MIKNNISFYVVDVLEELIMNIKEVSEKSGVFVDIICYYECIGLILFIYCNESGVCKFGVEDL